VRRFIFERLPSDGFNRAMKLPSFVLIMLVHPLSKIWMVSRLYGRGIASVFIGRLIVIIKGLGQDILIL
jgi:hypothetical protein